VSPLQDDDDFLAEAKRQAGEQDDPFLVEAERQHRGLGATIKRSARATLRNTIALLTEGPKQFTGGLAQSGLATLRGAERLLTPVTPSAGGFGAFASEPPPPDRTIQSTPVQRLTEEIRETYGEPESTPGTVAQLAGRLTGDVAQYASGARALGAVGALPKGTGVGARVARGIVGAAPVDVAQSAAGPEQSSLGAVAELADSPTLRRAARSTPLRVATEVGIGGLLNVGAELIGDLLKRARDVQKAARQAGRPETITEVDALANEARDLSLKTDRTPEDVERVRLLGRRIEELSADVPAAPPVEESALARSAEPEPLPTDIIERERRRYPVTEASNLRRRATDVAGDEFDRAAREMAATPPSVTPLEQSLEIGPMGAQLLRAIKRNPKMTIPGIFEAFRRRARGGAGPTMSEVQQKVAELESRGLISRSWDAQGNPRYRAASPASTARAPGAPADEAAVQQGLFGERTLAGREQTELLSETAGVPTARLRETKIQPDEVARVRREGAEPEGAQPMALPLGERSKKFTKMDDPGLESRYFQILDRMQESGRVAWEGTTPWVRKAERSADAGTSGAGRGFGGYSREKPVLSGNAVSNKAGRAMGRMKDDSRIAAELEAELAARGISHDDVLERYLVRQSPQETADEAIERAAIEAEGKGEMGAANRRLVALLARTGLGGTAGGTVGAQIGGTPEERHRNAVIAAIVGAGGAAVAPRLLPKSRAGITSAVPDVSRAARGAFAEGPQAAKAAAGPINPDDYVNVAKFALDPGGEKRLRNEVTRVVEAEGLHPKQRISWTETKRMAATIGLRPQDLVQREAARLNGAEMLAIRNIVSTNVDAIEGMSKRLGDATLTPELRERFERAISGLESQNDALLGKFVQARSAAGRDLNNLKILANRTLDPVTWLVKTQRLTGDAGFTPEVRTNVLRLIHEGDRAGLVRYLASVRQTPWYEKMTTLWKAGLLTNPKTHAVNITSNTTMAILETAKDNPAVVFDRLMSLWTGEITKAPTTLATLAASAKGARQGARDAWQILKGQGSADALQRFDIPREVNFDNAILDTYTKTVFRLLGAEDRVFRGAALQRSLSEQARILASREGLKGRPRSARIVELLESPTDEMVLTAIRDAEVATFTDVTELSRGISGFFGQLKSPAFRTAAEFVLPFKRTPAAVATRVFEYSPFGFVGGAADAWKVFRQATKGHTVTALQKRAAERLGRATTGASAILVGMWLYEKGLATGAAPSFNTREREQWRTEGKQPNSILIGGKWRNVGRLSPLGNVIALGANMAHALDANKEQTVAGRFAELAAGTVRTVADQPFVTGIRQATEAVLSPEEAAAEFGTNLAASAVPAGVAAIARTVDPTIRRSQGVGQRIQSRIPGASKGQPAVRDVFGKEATREPGVIANIFDPTSPSSDRRVDDPLIREMSRVGAAIGRLKRDSDETPEAFEQRQITYGQRLRTRLERVVRGEVYRRGDAEKQAEMLEDAVTDLRRQMSRRRRKRSA